MKDALKRGAIALAAIVLFAALSMAKLEPRLAYEGAALGFLVLPLVCCCLGPAAGCAVGGAGQALCWLFHYDMHWSILERLWPRLLGAILGSAAAGLILGALFLVTRQWEQPVLRILLGLAAAIAAAAAGLWLIRSLVDTQMMGFSLQNALRRNMDVFQINGAFLAAGVLPALGAYRILRKTAPWLCGADAEAQAEYTWENGKEEKHGGI